MEEVDKLKENLNQLKRKIIKSLYPVLTLICKLNLRYKFIKNVSDITYIENKRNE